MHFTIFFPSFLAGIKTETNPRGSELLFLEFSTGAVNKL
jgi:hypothetical protein